MICFLYSKNEIIVSLAQIKGSRSNSLPGIFFNFSKKDYIQAFIFTLLYFIWINCHFFSFLFYFGK